MPSNALQKFESNLLVDVDRLIDSHVSLNHVGMGRRGLGHITRSGVMMLCAAWELYIEELIVESAAHISMHCQTPHQFPLSVRKFLAKATRESKHELKPLELSGEGWKTVYLSHVKLEVKQLNTPKSTLLDPLFERLLGVAALSHNWSLGPDIINNFVQARGDIAHRGRDTRYVRIDTLREYREQITRTVRDNDNFMADYLQGVCPDRRSPWRRRNV